MTASKEAKGESGPESTVSLVLRGFTWGLFGMAILSLFFGAALIHRFAEADGLQAQVDGILCTFFFGTAGIFLHMIGKRLRRKKNQRPTESKKF